MSSIPTFTGRTVTNISFPVLIGATDVRQQCPAFVVPPGCVVRVRAHNGTDAGNAKPVRVQTNSSNEVLNANTEVMFPVQSTGEIFIVGTKDDGVVISIKG